MRIRLTAKLDRPGGTVILCGSCLAEVGGEVFRAGGRVDLVEGYTLKDGHLRIGGQRVGDRVIDAHASKQKHGVFELSKHSLKSWLVRGRFADRRRRRVADLPVHDPKRVGAPLPVLLKCPWCARLQWLTSEALDIPGNPLAMARRS